MIVVTTFQYTGYNMLRTFSDHPAELEQGERAAAAYERELKSLGYTPMRCKEEPRHD